MSGTSTAWRRGINPIDLTLYDALIAVIGAEQSQSSKEFVVAFSGGLDSTVLLHSLVRLQQLLNAQKPTALANGERSNKPVFQLSACHVDHQLSPNHLAWRQHCTSFAQNLDVDIFCCEVEVTPSGQGLEAAARKARYGAFDRIINSNNKILLLAHHRDDQAESLLLRLSRGHGISGLKGIPSERLIGQGKALRPFLDQDRDTLLAYAKRHKLIWIEDESNTDIELDRNFVRHEVLPQLNRRWPGFSQNLGVSTRLLEEQFMVLEELARNDLQLLENSRLVAGACLELSKANDWSLARQKNLLRHWFESRDIHYLNREQWQQIAFALENLKDAALNNRELRLKNAAGDYLVFRFYDGALFLDREFDFARLEEDLNKVFEGIVIHGKKISGSEAIPPVTIENRCDQFGVLRCELGLSEGEKDAVPLRLEDIKAGCYRWVSADNFLSIGTNGIHKSMKKIFQSKRIPYWQRHCFPVLAYKEKPVVLPSILVSDTIDQTPISNNNEHIRCRFSFHFL